MRVGIHWGSSLYIGQLVPGGRLDVTALGDAVNECARIQECAEPHQTLASKELIERMTDDDKAAVGIDQEKVRYVPLSSMPGISEKALAAVGTIPVSDSLAAAFGHQGRVEVGRRHPEFRRLLVVVRVRDQSRLAVAVGKEAQAEGGLALITGRHDDRRVAGRGADVRVGVARGDDRVEVVGQQASRRSRLVRLDRRLADRRVVHARRRIGRDQEVLSVLDLVGMLLVVGDDVAQGPAPAVSRAVCSARYWLSEALNSFGISPISLIPTRLVFDRLSVSTSVAPGFSRTSSAASNRPLLPDIVGL